MKKLFRELLRDYGLLPTCRLLPAFEQTTDNNKWILIASDEKRACFFDSGTIVPVDTSRAPFDASKEIFIVWLKTQYTPAYAQEWVKQCGWDKEQYQGFSYAIEPYKIDLRNNKSLAIEFANYDYDGCLIDGVIHNDDVEKWEDIAPGHCICEAAFDIIKEHCLQKYKKVGGWR